MAPERRGRTIVLISTLVASTLLLPFPTATNAGAEGLPNPPTLKWSVWFPMQTTSGYDVLPVPLPTPIRGAGLAVLAWFRTQEGLYTPMVRMLRGSDGALLDEVRGLPSMFPWAAAILLNTTGSGVPQEIVAGGMDDITDIDLQQGRVRWRWHPPLPDGQPLAGPPLLIQNPAPLLIALDWGGSLYGVDPADGGMIWKIPGQGNTSQMSSPAFFTLGGGRVVAATESPQWNETWVMTRPAHLRLVDLDSGQTRWTIPLSANPFASPTIVRADLSGDSLVVFLDLNGTQAPPATHRAFAVSASTGVVRWNATWDGGWYGDPTYASSVIDTPQGPTLFAPGDAGRILKVEAWGGTLAQVQTSCSTTGAAWDVLSELFPLDFLGDGGPELLGVASGGEVCAFSVPDLDVLWSHNTTHTNLLDPALGDIDQDGEPELVVVSEGGYLTAFDINPIHLIETPSWVGPALLGLGIAVAGVAVLAAWIVWRRRRNRKAGSPEPQKESNADPGARNPDAKGKL